jgi:hypothetical protein
MAVLFQLKRRAEARNELHQEFASLGGKAFSVDAFFAAGLIGGSTGFAFPSERQSRRN